MSKIEVFLNFQRKKFHIFNNMLLFSKHLRVKNDTKQFSYQLLVVTIWVHCLEHKLSGKNDEFWVRISYTFSVLRPFSYLRPFLYVHRSNSTSAELCTLTFSEIWISYWSRSTGRSTVLVEVKRSK